MIFLAVVNNQPKEMGLVQALQHFVDHRIDVVRRRTAYLLMKAREREHVLEGYQVALDRVDDVIRIIRGSENRADARTNLVDYFTGKTVSVSEGKSAKTATLKGVTRRHAAHNAVRHVASRCHPRIATAPLTGCRSTKS
jgi:DNA gyrase subunit A